jgi:hypothetical protein
MRRATPPDSREAGFMLAYEGRTVLFRALAPRRNRITLWASSTAAWSQHLWQKFHALVRLRPGRRRLSNLKARTSAFPRSYCLTLTTIAFSTGRNSRRRRRTGRTKSRFSGRRWNRLSSRIKSTGRVEAFDHHQRLRADGAHYRRPLSRQVRLLSRRRRQPSCGIAKIDPKGRAGRRQGADTGTTGGVLQYPLRRPEIIRAFSEAP